MSKIFNFFVPPGEVGVSKSITITLQSKHVSKSITICTLHTNLADNIIKCKNTWVVWITVRSFILLYPAPILALKPTSIYIHVIVISPLQVQCDWQARSPRALKPEGDGLVHHILHELGCHTYMCNLFHDEAILITLQHDWIVSKDRALFCLVCVGLATPRTTPQHTYQTSGETTVHSVRHKNTVDVSNIKGIYTHSVEYSRFIALWSPLKYGFNGK